MPELIFPGPEGRLEGRYHQAEMRNAPAAVVLHPHPLYGGTMNNKIVYRTYKAFADNGFSVLRFNFRGVGRSQGKFDDGLGELSDAATALDWIQTQNPDASSYWISGFSFGAWISLQLLMRRPEINSFIAMSPPANMYDFSFLSPCPAKGIVIQGDRDDIVNEPAVADLAKKLNAQRGTTAEYQMIQGADHYYRNYMDELIYHSEGFIKSRIKELSEAPKVRPDRKRRQPPRETPQSSEAS